MDPQPPAWAPPSAPDVNNTRALSQQPSNEIQVTPLVDDGYFDVGQPGSTNEEIKNDPIVEAMIVELVKEPFYHGGIDVIDLPEILEMDGDYGIRICEKKNENSHHITPSLHLAVVANYRKRIYEVPIIYMPDPDNTALRLVTLNFTLKKNTVRDLLEEHKLKKIAIEPGVLIVRPVSRKTWQLPKEDLEFCDKLGEGAFGTVWRGKLKTKKNKTGECEIVDVAIKVTKICNENKDNMDEMLKEARLMRQLTHKNIVQFYGMVKETESAMIVMELVTGGSLDSYIQKNPTCSQVVRTNFCVDIALGIEYLHSQKTVHRDVAARNCLIATMADGKRKKAKLSDFGMSRRGDRIQMTWGDRMPIRWQAPEVLTEQMYTAKCDVYSYGMLMWEIFSGKVPYQGTDTKIIRQKIRDPNFRPPIENVEPPPPDYIVEVALNCWNHNAKERPTMRSVGRAIAFGYMESQKKQAPAKKKTPLPGLKSMTKSVLSKSKIKMNKGTLSKKRAPVPKTNSNRKANESNMKKPSKMNKPKSKPKSKAKKKKKSDSDSE